MKLWNLLRLSAPNAPNASDTAELVWHEEQKEKWGFFTLCNRTDIPAVTHIPIGRGQALKITSFHPASRP